MRTVAALSLLALVAAPCVCTAGGTGDALDLSLYVPAGVHPFDETPAFPAPETTLEASAISYDADTDSLFVMGDEGEYLVEVDREAKLQSYMTLLSLDLED